MDVKRQASNVRSFPIIFIVGPTASGKSALAIELARHLDGEIICCDAMQVYRELIIATDRPSQEFTALITHHLYGVIDVEEDFNAARWRDMAMGALVDIRSRGKTPIFCGGSGMYVMALLDGLFEGASASEPLRQQLMDEAQRSGWQALYDRLLARDPEAAKCIHPNNHRRIVRALEVMELTKGSFSQMKLQREGLWGKEAIRLVGIERSRQELYDRVEARVEDMFRDGLVEEVRSLQGRTLGASAARIIGIPEVSGYLRGEHDLDHVKTLMKLNTRHYVKRQLTWFRRDERIIWVDACQTKDIAQEVLTKVCSHE